MLNYTIPAARSPFLDQSGSVNRDWYLFLCSIFEALGSGTTSYGMADVEYLATRSGKRVETKADEQVPPTRSSTSKADKSVEQLEEYVASLKRSRKQRIKTTSTLYPALTLIQKWAGAIGSIPTGWQLCDGTAGTPDLRNLFVIGAGSTYPIGATGGSTTIAANNLPTHTHAYNDQYNVTTANQTNLLYTAGAASLSVTTSVTETSTSAASNTGNNTTTASAYLPPFYALAYIVNTAAYTVINSVELQD